MQVHLRPNSYCLSLTFVVRKNNAFGRATVGVVVVKIGNLERRFLFFSRPRNIKFFLWFGGVAKLHKDVVPLPCV